MNLFITVGDRKFDFECFDNDASKEHASNIIQWKTYQIVPFVRDIKVILDIGANVGAVSFIFGLQCPQAHIFALEPGKSPFSLAQKNNSWNPNTQVFNVGLFDSDKKVPLFHSSVDTVTASVHKSVFNTEASEEVELRDALSWVQEQRIETIDILKIDTEGCEYQILSSLKPMLSNISVVYLEYHSEEDRLRIDALLSSTHILYRSRAEKTHCGESTYVNLKFAESEYEVTRHRIKPLPTR